VKNAEIIKKYLHLQFFYVILAKSILEVNIMTKKLKVDGMSCKHCAARVESALASVAGVKKAKVKLKEGIALVKLDAEIADSIFKTAIEEAGYELKEVTA
jgi:copper ion binding protein